MEFTYKVGVGQVVKSISGRDMGRLFIILDIIDERYVTIVDGKYRKLSNPKKKKMKHLSVYNSFIDVDVEHFNDSYIRKNLLPYMSKIEE